MNRRKFLNFIASAIAVVTLPLSLVTKKLTKIIYTIGPSSHADFKTLSEAVDKLNDNVVLEIEPNPNMIK